MFRGLDVTKQAWRSLLLFVGVHVVHSSVCVWILDSERVSCSCCRISESRSLCYSIRAHTWRPASRKSPGSGSVLEFRQQVLQVCSSYTQAARIQTTQLDLIQNGSCRLVGPALWPVTPKLGQSLHQVARKVCGTTRYVCQVELGVNQWHPGEPLC